VSLRKEELIAYDKLAMECESKRRRVEDLYLDVCDKKATMADWESAMADYLTASRRRDALWSRIYK
jgi:hypothetical protein